MAITKKLVHQMDGSITVQSTLGKGSVFTVTIPFAFDAEMEVQEALLEEEREQPADISGMHILLVEDNELNSEIAQCILEDAGAVPIIALSANAFSEDAKKAKEAGMNGHVAKPLDIRVLFKAMNKFR